MNQRLARVNLVWVGRPEALVDWCGPTLVGKTPEKVLIGTPLVGTPLGVVSAINPLWVLGYRVDATTAIDRPSADAQGEPGRIDPGVALQEEIETALRDPTLPHEMHEKVEARWTARGWLQDKPQDQPH